MLCSADLACLFLRQGCCAAVHSVAELRTARVAQPAWAGFLLPISPFQQVTRVHVCYLLPRCCRSGCHHRHDDDCGGTICRAVELQRRHLPLHWRRGFPVSGAAPALTSHSQHCSCRGIASTAAAYSLRLRLLRHPVPRPVFCCVGVHHGSPAPSWALCSPASASGYSARWCCGTTTPTSAPFTSWWVLSLPPLLNCAACVRLQATAGTKEDMCCARVPCLLALHLLLPCATIAPYRPLVTACSRWWCSSLPGSSPSSPSRRARSDGSCTKR